MIPLIMPSSQQSTLEWAMDLVETHRDNMHAAQMKQRLTRNLRAIATRDGRAIPSDAMSEISSYLDFKQDWLQAKHLLNLALKLKSDLQCGTSAWWKHQGSGSFHVQ